MTDRIETLVTRLAEGAPYDGPPMMARRAAVVVPGTWDEAKRTLRYVFSRGAIVRRRIVDWFGDTVDEFDEELVIEPGSVRLGRLNAGAPFLDSHDSDGLGANLLGKIVEGSAVAVPGANGEPGTLEGDVYLADTPDVADKVRKVVTGIARNGSVGYWTHRTEIIERDGLPPLHRVVDWEPGEFSACPVGADAGAQSRSQRNANSTPAASGRTQEGDSMDPTKDPQGAERERVAAVRALIPVAVRNGVPQAEADKAIDDGRTPEQFRARMLDALLEGQAGTEIRTHVSAGGQDATETRVEAVRDAVDVLMGNATELSERARDLRGMGPLALVGERMEIAGFRMRGRTRSEIARMGLRVGGHTTSDFPFILANSLQKRLRKEAEASPLYRWYERIATRNGFQDFETRDYPTLLGPGLLPVVPEGADYVQIHMGEGRERAAAVKRGGEIQLTWEMLIADNLGAFTRAGLKVAKASRVTRSAVFGGLLTTPQTMGDGQPLFTLAGVHRNLSASAGAPTIARLAELDGFLRDNYESDPDGNDIVIGEPLQFLFLPTTHRTTVEQLYSPQYSPTAAANAVTVDVEKDNRIYVPGWTGNAWGAGTGSLTAAEWGNLAEDGGLVITDRIEQKSDSIVYHARDVFGCVILEFQAFAWNAGA